jgi:hypothetical protein
MVHEPRRTMDSTGVAICSADRLAADAAFAQYWAAWKPLAVQGVGRALCKFRVRCPAVWRHGCYGFWVLLLAWSNPLRLPWNLPHEHFMDTAVFLSLIQINSIMLPHTLQWADVTLPSLSNSRRASSVICKMAWVSDDSSGGFMVQCPNSSACCKSKPSSSLYSGLFLYPFCSR